MTTRLRRCIGAITAAVMVCALVVAVTGQTPARTGGGKPAARTLQTAWGDPDLQGTWTNTTTTPLERLPEAGDKTVLSEEEREALARLVDERLNRDKNPADSTGSYNDFWFERGTLGTRTALIIDPPEGRLPPFTPDAQKRLEAQRQERRDHPADSWLNLNSWVRCLSRGLPGAMIPAFYNHNYEIVQARGYVAILIEMIHDTRIIPLDGRPHLHPHVGQWLGDARGHFEGNTLVVETTNFNDKVFDRTAGFGSGTRLVERFTRVDADHLDYEFTVDAPKVFTRPWTVSTPMEKLSGEVYEYACHEGNHALRGILAGARAEERRATENGVK